MMSLSVPVFILHILLPLTVLVPQRTISFGFVDTPKSFLPHQVQSDGERAVSSLLFRPLFKWEDGVLKEDLVDSTSTNDTKTEYRIRLKQNQHWQDGALITSDDVIYSLTLRESLREDIDISKLSDREVLIRLPNENGILKELLTFGIEPEHLRNQNPLWPVGSTSYYLARQTKERRNLESIVLHSFDTEKQYQRIAFHFYEKEQDLQTAYRLGEIQVFFSQMPFQDDRITQRIVHFMGRYYALAFQTGAKEKLASPELRKKLASYISVPKLLEGNFYAAALATDGPISGSSYYTRGSIENLGTQSQTQAPQNEENKLTEQEKTQIGTLRIVLPDTQDGKQLEPFLREHWEKEAGLELSFQYHSLADITEIGQDGAFDVIFVGHEVTPDPDRYSFWHSTQSNGGLNYGRFDDLRADKALEDGRKSDQPSVRQRHYNIFQDAMETKTPAIFLYHPGMYLSISKQYPFSQPKLFYTPADIVQNL